jgi:hypothetical protein
MASFAPRTLRGVTIFQMHVPLLAHRPAELSGIDIRDC